MHVGLVMECDYREGRTQEEAFAEAMSIAEIAETHGLDGVWLAERHFAMHRRPTDPMGAGIPSAPPRRPQRSIRSARGASTSASGAAAFPAPTRATASRMTKAASAFRNR